MPFALLVIGLFLLVAGVRGSQDSLFTLVQGDFSGNDNFVYWFASIILIGLLGYVPKLKHLSWAFLALILVVLLLSKGGFFGKLTSALGTTQQGQLSAAQQQMAGLQTALGQSLSADPLNTSLGQPITGVQPPGTFNTSFGLPQLPSLGISN